MASDRSWLLTSKRLRLRLSVPPLANRATRGRTGWTGGLRVTAASLTITWEGQPVRLAVVGEIDLATREQFGEALAQTFGSDGDTLLDLRGVPFMDTHSVTAVVHCANRLHH